MSDSYPTMQESLSDVQRDFMGCVEMHLDPPEDGSPTYAVEAMFRSEGGDSIRFSLSVDEDDADISERRHTIEFFDPGAVRLKGWVRHSIKRIESIGGRLFWTESRFQVGAPGLPEGQARHAEVEREVQQLVNKVRVLDRSRRLVEVAGS